MTSTELFWWPLAATLTAAAICAAVALAHKEPQTFLKVIYPALHVGLPLCLLTLMIYSMGYSNGSSDALSFMAAIPPPSVVSFEPSSIDIFSLVLLSFGNFVFTQALTAYAKTRVLDTNTEEK